MARSSVKITLIVIMVLIVAAFFVSLIAGLAGRSLGEKIGVLEIEGVITDTKDAIEDVVKFKEDDSIKGVIVRINSPGGSTAPTQEIFRELKKLRDKKKVYVSMGSVCASGGYYIASAGEKIYALPSTITGSIGVIMENVVMEDLLKKIGIQADPIKAGAYKDIGSPFRKMKADERAYLQEIIDTIHNQFMKDIADSRKMNIETVKKYADGRVFTGSQAKAFGMVDAIGTYHDAVDDMKKALNIKGKPVLVHGKKPFSLLRMLVSSLYSEVYTNWFSAPFKFIMTLK
ncbi:MAG TPA: signal peptide peptidase SppA [Syntrophorhabdaceae bacterium]|nr:signal peptide peptidase SppA [Syntrophorhabdaceae bacterium]HOL05448.1 signal peptide peptidase SppA [Syntrophorhabdaceae bacterium]HON85090.1 signal peptide peptidase SppA [Syntrophorhabdaceae bacterium]HOT42574.1 signal peptide peptidase SppA [Syntrophorhabdaceae bacterium]HPC66752.1 signal peptide peptidase SppA [Syntrophorhabdaceae bacterium]